MDTKTSAEYMATCLFLVVLAAGSRALVAGWSRRSSSQPVQPPRDPAFARKFSTGLFVLGSPTPNPRSQQRGGAAPFRWATDVPRALYAMATAGVGYLLCVVPFSCLGGWPADGVGDTQDICRHDAQYRVFCGRAGGYVLGRSRVWQVCDELLRDLKTRERRRSKDNRS